MFNWLRSIRVKLLFIIILVIAGLIVAFMFYGAEHAKHEINYQSHEYVYSLAKGIATACEELLQEGRDPKELNQELKRIGEAHKNVLAIKIYVSGMLAASYGFNDKEVAKVQASLSDPALFEYKCPITVDVEEEKVDCGLVHVQYTLDH